MLTLPRRNGAALLAFVATLMLMAGGIGAAIVHFLLAGRQLATQQLDREIAFRAAEAALRDAEADLMAATRGTSQRLAAWPAPGTCGDGPQRGICMAGGNPPVWHAWFDNRGDAGDGIGVPLGTFTGAALPALPDDVIGANRLPRYLIEIQDDPPEPGMWPRLRVIALGMGRDPEVRVLLQTEFQP